MRLDRPSNSGSDKPPANQETAGEAGEGTGWPQEKVKTPEVRKTPEERIKDLESENKSLKFENMRMEATYTAALQDLKQARDDLKSERTSREKLIETNAQLTDTNAILVRDNRELREKVAYSPDIDRKLTGDTSQDVAVKKDAHRKNWFPTDTMGRLGGAVAGVGGTYAVMVGLAGSKEEAFGIALTSAGVAGLAMGREITTNINNWRDRRAAKNADR